MSEVTKINTLRNIPEADLARLQQDFLDYGASIKVRRQPDGKYEIEAVTVEIAPPLSGSTSSSR
jgi:hypothetical protein